MINWFKNKIEEAHLRKLLKLALNDANIKKNISVGAATFTMRPTQSVLPDATKNQRTLVGEYKEWPTFKRSPADCILDMGSFHIKSGPFYSKLSAIIFSKRVVGFLFTYDSDHVLRPINELVFTANLKQESEFEPPPGFPAWLPTDQISSSDVNEEYDLPQGYKHDSLREIFRWFAAFQSKGYILNRPDDNDKVDFNGEVFLIVGKDDSENLLVLSKTHHSLILMLDHEINEPIAVETEIKNTLGYK